MEEIFYCPLKVKQRILFQKNLKDDDLKIIATFQ